MSDIPYGQTKSDGFEEGFFFAWQVFTSMGFAPPVLELSEQVRKVTEGSVELPTNATYEKDKSRYSQKEGANIVLPVALSMVIWRKKLGFS